MCQGMNGVERVHLSDCAHADESDSQVANVWRRLESPSPLAASNDGFGLGRGTNGLEDELDGGEGGWF